MVTNLDVPSYLQDVFPQVCCLFDTGLLLVKQATEGKNGELNSYSGTSFGAIQSFRHSKNLVDLEVLKRNNTQLSNLAASKCLASNDSAYYPAESSDTS
jgi:hypothetical protein